MSIINALFIHMKLLKKNSEFKKKGTESGHFPFSWPQRKFFQISPLSILLSIDLSHTTIITLGIVLLFLVSSGTPS